MHQVSTSISADSDHPSLKSQLSIPLGTETRHPDLHRLYIYLFLHRASLFIFANAPSPSIHLCTDIHYLRFAPCLSIHLSTNRHHPLFHLASPSIDQEQRFFYSTIPHPIPTLLTDFFHSQILGVTPYNSPSLHKRRLTLSLSHSLSLSLSLYFSLLLSLSLSLSLTRNTSIDNVHQEEEEEEI
ncbi:unnamed protein product [Acanthosepion pharaonis]|uniref:Uncharacterized protein n=1 Tax=Acanthosepion pharaonis TaxID=158019 RepID=A0A812ESR6_ACAPH|nr:unnamed protein product [Sepia pharaonis]